MSELIYPELSYQVQGALFDVYKQLQYFDLSEEGWERALVIALQQRSIAAVRQVEYELRYKGVRIGRFLADVLADEKILLELKVNERLLPINLAQLITYLKVTQLQLGILVNFGGNKLEWKRVPNFVNKRHIHQLEPVVIKADNSLLYPELTHELRAALFEVHCELGPGLMPMHYRRATQIEMRLRSLPFTVKKDVSVHFRGQPIETRKMRLLIVDAKILLSIITVRTLTERTKTQLRHFMHQFDLPIGLIANFHQPSLEVFTLRNDEKPQIK